MEQDNRGNISLCPHTLQDGVETERQNNSPSRNFSFLEVSIAENLETNMTKLNNLAAI